MSIDRKNISWLGKMVGLVFLTCIPFFGLAQSGDTAVTEITLDSMYEDYETAQPDTEPTVDEPYTGVSLSDSVIFRSVPDTTVERLQKSPEFEYANNPDYWTRKEIETKKQNNNRSLNFLQWLFTSAAVRMFMYLLLAAILIYAVYRIIVNNSLFYNSAKKFKKADESESDVVNDDNIDTRISSAIAARDWRNAVRYLYLKSLRVLDAKGLIRYHPEATNFEYVNQLGNHPLAADFRFQTTVYEYVWYGDFEITEERFHTVHDNFLKLYKGN